MVLYGASGHAKVIADSINCLKEDILHYFDDNNSINFFLNRKVSKYDQNIFPNEKLIISVGNNKHRENLVKKIKHTFGIIIHPSSIISEHTKIDEGTVVLQNSTIQADSKIGKHCIINTAASVDHDCIIDNFVHVSPHATLCGNVKIGEGTNIGAGAIILPGIQIGKWSIIGAGTIVLEDIPDKVVVVGNPGRIIKIMKQ
jgi:sugar O-acyltransferase (sialic acid O-acetyltransferase NeuD family)